MIDEPETLSGFLNLQLTIGSSGIRSSRAGKGMKTKSRISSKPVFAATAITGSFMSYVFRTLECAGRGIRPTRIVSFH
jgi:hypothetical protein